MSLISRLASSLFMNSPSSCVKSNKKPLRYETLLKNFQIIQQLFVWYMIQHPKMLFIDQLCFILEDLSALYLYEPFIVYPSNLSTSYPNCKMITLVINVYLCSRFFRCYFFYKLHISYFVSHSTTSSVPVLLLTKGRDGFALAVNIMMLYFFDNSLKASTAGKRFSITGSIVKSFIKIVDYSIKVNGYVFSITLKSWWEIFF